MIPDAAVEHYRSQQKITVELLDVARSIWGSRPPRDFDVWFSANINLLLELMTAGQTRAVAGAESYTGEVLDELGTPVDPEVDALTEGLVGVASDGRALDTLMYGAVIHSKGRVAEGRSLAQAWQSGFSALALRMQTQLADASRAATSLSIVSRKRVGYTRMLNPPSCGRCAILAGRTYKWNAGFKRHPGCDCRHIPCREDRAGDLRTDPDRYFNSLSTEQQNKMFTKSGAEAIRDGADVSQVVNASRGVSTAQVYGQELRVTSEGVTRRGEAYRAMSRAGYAQRETDVRSGRYFQARAPRLMPETIYSIAENRADALRLLKLYGYLA